MAAPPWMIYGAYGYTGRLIAEEAVRRRARPVLAGRSEEKLRALGTRLGLDWRAFGLDDPKAIDRGLTGIDVVLNAAGPFGGTCRPVLDGCIRMGTTYCDIAGELDAYEAMFARQEEVRSAGIAVVPGVGFDVVPTDCLAMRAARELPGATLLELGVGTSGGASGGTLRATVRMAAQGGRARRNGELVREAVGDRAFTVRLPSRERAVVSAPLSDLVSAFESTAIPNISTYLVVPAPLRAIAVGGARFGSWLASITPVRAAVDALIGRFVDGPDEEALDRSRTETWLRVTRGDETIDYYLDAPGGYSYTMVCANLAVDRLLERRTPGVHSPAGAFGEEFMFEVPQSTLWRRVGRGAWEQVEHSRRMQPTA
jgi:short subunit dehydrogenase-like uncharacterized protein